MDVNESVAVAVAKSIDENLSNGEQPEPPCAPADQNINEISDQLINTLSTYKKTVLFLLDFFQTNNIKITNRENGISLVIDNLRDCIKNKRSSSQEKEINENIKKQINQYLSELLL